MKEFILNGKKRSVDVPDGTPLLWVIREELKLKGTKFGCGKGLCGACTVHVEGNPTRTCILPVESVQDQKVDTIESYTDGELHPIQKAWIKNNVPQCGYCQSGQIMVAISIIEQKETWQEDELRQQFSTNLCRCGTYNDIEVAMIDGARQMGKLK